MLYFVYMEAFTYFSFSGIFLVSLFYYVNAALPQRAQDQPPLPLKNCQEKTGATPADIEALRSRKMPQTKTGKCFLECIFESVRILEDKKFNKKGMVVVFSPTLRGDFSKLGKLKELSEVCEKEIGPDPIQHCEGATRVVKCVANHGKDYGISFPKARI